jgi:porphobilinogen synthase
MASSGTTLEIQQRLRRMRRNDAVRALGAETLLSASNLILPVFVLDGDAPPEEISSMPGVKRLNLADTVELAKRAWGVGVRGLALFPASVAPALKNEEGTEAWNGEGLIQRSVRRLREEIPGLCIVTDVALDPYTTSGHDGISGETPHGHDLLNDVTVEALVKQALSHAEAGTTFVAPSDMMDGRVGAIRKALDKHGFEDVGILAYSAKYASCFYGPFREAVGSAKAAGTRSLDKRTYQMNPANRREACLEVELDEAEGADMVMVKPAGPYLDVIRDVREATRLPVAAYQVSGEYAMLAAAGERGWLDFEAAAMESLLGIRRAGADVILTYFALRAGEILAERAAALAPSVLRVRDA